MSRAGAIGAAAAAVVAVVAAGLLLLGGGDAPTTRPGPGPSTATSDPPSERSAPKLTPPPRPGDPARPTAEAPSTDPRSATTESAATGPALAAQVARIVRDGEGAKTEAAERQAAQALERLLEEVGARGEAGLGDVASLVEPTAPPGVQEVGVRLLARVGGADALRRLAALAAAPRSATPARLLALRGLDTAPASGRTLARSTIVSVLRARGEAEVRAFAASLLADDAGAEDDLAAVVGDRSDELAVRAAAHEALAALDPTRARRTLDAVKDDPALTEWLKQAPR